MKDELTFSPSMSVRLIPAMSGDGLEIPSPPPFVSLQLFLREFVSLSNFPMTRSFPVLSLSTVSRILSNTCIKPGLNVSMLLTKVKLSMQEAPVPSVIFPKKSTAFSPPIFPPTREKNPGRTHEIRQVNRINELA